MGRLMLRGRSESGWMAVVRMGERIDLAHVVRSVGGRPEIRSCDSFRMEGDLADALARLAQGHSLKRFRCATLLQESEYRLLQVEAPAVPVAERVQALRWRLKDAVDFPVDDAAVAIAEIPAESGRQANVFAVVAPAAAVGRQMKTFHAAKLPLEAIDIPEMALRNIATLFEEPNRGLAFLALLDGESILSITCDGELYLSRRIDLSSKALAAADEGRRGQMLERLALELQRTLDTFDRQYGMVSVAKMLVASDHDPLGLVAVLADNLYLPVEVMDLARGADFSALPELQQPERQGQCLLAIGAALRSEA